MKKFGTVQFADHPLKWFHTSVYNAMHSPISHC